MTAQRRCVCTIDLVDLGNQPSRHRPGVGLDRIDRLGEVASVELVALERFERRLELVVQSAGGRLGKRRRLAETLELFDCLFDLRLVGLGVDLDARLEEGGQVVGEEALVVALRQRICGCRRLW